MGAERIKSGVGMCGISNSILDGQELRDGPTLVYQRPSCPSMNSPKHDCTGNAKPVLNGISLIPSSRVGVEFQELGDALPRAIDV